MLFWFEYSDSDLLISPVLFSNTVDLAKHALFRIVTTPTLTLGEKDGIGEDKRHNRRINEA